ncbi:transcription termination factor MTERF2, chloroplastic isoform X2 [Phalaenopsis equestris]|uniref:transcription termination factor MTERF2, chloroplastic isoform X2 n=1 Tax=Phalaenopsis equestris TaxID=78828 RepID=UPI0009E3AFF7|nr:transcription termination factor MTERF2, chloroplastic isoform X2 [Phalaenopsis equestris]
MLLCHSSPGSYSPALYHGGLRPNLNPSSLHLISPLQVSPLPSPSSSQRQEFVAVIDESDHTRLSRRQNARSAALFRLHEQQEKINMSSLHEEEDGEELQRQKIVDEASLVTKRIARFPGSIDFPKEDAVVVLGSDEQAFKQALEIRRGVAAEVLKVMLSAGRLSKPYSAKIVSCLLKFVDQVVIEAAEMKVVREFSHLSFNARAKSYIQRSGVVNLVKWLKHNSLTYPQIGQLICFCSSNLEAVRRLAEWLKTIHVKGKYLGYVLVKASSILEYKLEMLDQIVDYLAEKGVKKEWMGFIVSRCPRVLTLSMDEIKSRVNFYMHMGMDEKDFGTMVYDYPKVLGFFTLEEMNSKVNYLTEFGLSTEELGRLLSYKPQLMGCSVEERWRPLLKYLYYLGVRRDGMKRILMAKPVIFCVDLERTIAPKVRFLQDIGIRQEDIGSVIARFPPLLTYSLYKKIRPVVIFLLTEAGVTQENIAKVIACDPQIVGCSIINKLDVNVKYFLSLGIRLQTLGEMIADFPMLLRYNLDVLRPKYRYLRRVMVRPLHDLIEFPSYSLDERIIPRHEILVQNHVNFNLRCLLASSDEEFNQRVQAFIENRRKFEYGEVHANLSNTESHLEIAVTS